MKKTLMTLVAVGFGVSVAFAQTTGEGVQQDTEHNQQQTQQTEAYGQDEEGKKRIEMYELPVAVQDAFKNGQYSEWEVLAIYEMSDDQTHQESTEGVGMDTESQEQAVVYAFELVQNAQGDQSAMGQDDGTGVTTDDGMGGVETERVSDREADMIVHFDINGQVVKEKDADEIKQDKDKTDY